MNLTKSLHGTLIALGTAGVASAQIVPTVVVASDIAVSTTWGPPNIYELNGEIHVLDGATLTILPGTVIASDTAVTFPTVNPNGVASLSADRGAMLIANGTQTLPIVFTSKADGNTPAGGLSTNLTGSYRQTAGSEWGGLTLHGEGYICENQVVANTAAPSSSNYSSMEGLLRPGLRDYGGGPVVTAFASGFTSDGEGDNDDSGSLSYVSIRYNGYVAGSSVELNGLGLGGVGRNTELHHIESINSIDDGFEIWGGTCNLSYIVVWSCGDDSFDVDQGWRGKAQHGLIVQGYNAGVSSQGSGIGDNSFEMDGAELCHWQPVTTAVISNFTVVGAPDGNNPVSGANGGDHATAWRDNARVQFHNCLFMDTGDNVINNDLTDGENGNAVGYGCNGTLSWANTWLTGFATTSTVNPFGGAPELTPAQAYTAQTSGNLIEFRDVLFYNNVRPNAYAEANARGVLSPFSGNNANNLVASTLPIASITRAATATTLGAIVMKPVLTLDPRPVTTDARLSTEWAVAGSGLDGSRYRGGFGEGNLWTTGWSGMAKYGVLAGDIANVDLGHCKAGIAGCPQQVTTGTWAAGAPMNITIKNMDPLFSAGFLVAGFFEFNFPIFDGTLVPTPDILINLSGVGGEAQLNWINPPGGSGTTLYTQALVLDLIATENISFSNAQSHLQP